MVGDAEPERKWDMVKPVLILYAGGNKADLAPKANTVLVKFVTAKQLRPGIGQVARLR